MIVTIKNQKLTLKVNDLPVVIEHDKKTYFIKFSKKRNGLYMNLEEILNENKKTV